MFKSVLIVIPVLLICLLKLTNSDKSNIMIQSCFRSLSKNLSDFVSFVSMIEILSDTCDIEFSLWLLFCSIFDKLTC